MKINFSKKYTESMCDTPDQLLDLMSHIGYSDFSRLKSPLETFITTSGSCHDQVMLEFQELFDMGLSPRAKFIMAVDEDNQGGETHSFVYYEVDGKYFWFENAWEDMQGIHEYDSEAELIDAVMYAFGQRVLFDRLYIADFVPADHVIGEDLDTLVDICMNSAEEYKIG